MSNNNESAKKLSAKLFAAYETERAMKWLHGQNKEFAEKYPAGTPQPEQGETYWIIKNLLNIISDLKATSPRDWTPCAEGSPSKNDFYQTTERTRLGEIIRNVRHYGARGWQIKWGCGITVIAWQPLPAAWKEPENV